VTAITAVERVTYLNTLLERLELILAHSFLYFLIRFTNTLSICKGLLRQSCLLLITHEDRNRSTNRNMDRLTCAAHDFDAFANVLSGVKSLKVVLAADIVIIYS
jgi:hypothetical protein